MAYRPLSVLALVFEGEQDGVAVRKYLLEYGLVYQIAFLWVSLIS
jgi:hypothetical protein